MREKKIEIAVQIVVPERRGKRLRRVQTGTRRHVRKGAVPFVPKQQARITLQPPKKEVQVAIAIHVRKRRPTVPMVLQRRFRVGNASVLRKSSKRFPQDSDTAG